MNYKCKNSKPCSSFSCMKGCVIDNNVARYVLCIIMFARKIDSALFSVKAYAVHSTRLYRGGGLFDQPV